MPNQTNGEASENQWWLLRWLWEGLMWLISHNLSEYSYAVWRCSHPACNRKTYKTAVHAEILWYQVWKINHGSAHGAKWVCLWQAPKPSPGPHKERECLPLVVMLRNRLKYALTYREVVAIVMQRLIAIDGKVRTDKCYPAGFMGGFFWPTSWSWGFTSWMCHQ
jgi:hypothetical protein